MDPLYQIEENKRDIKNIKRGIDVMIKSFLVFVGHQDKIEEFQKVYGTVFSNETGINYFTNASTGQPTLTRFCRDGTQTSWALKIKEKEEKKEDEKDNS